MCTGGQEQRGFRELAIELCGLLELWLEPFEEIEDTVISAAGSVLELPVFMLDIFAFASPEVSHGSSADENRLST